jgi:hypothetical protein
MASSANFASGNKLPKRFADFAKRVEMLFQRHKIEWVASPNSGDGGRNIEEKMLKK